MFSMSFLLFDGVAIFVVTWKFGLPKLGKFNKRTLGQEVYKYKL
jgi:hypothetical protein